MKPAGLAPANRRGLQWRMSAADRGRLLAFLKSLEIGSVPAGWRGDLYAISQAVR